MKRYTVIQVYLSEYDRQKKHKMSEPILVANVEAKNANAAKTKAKKEKKWPYPTSLMRASLSTSNRKRKA